MSPAAKRRAVDMLKDTLSMSERLACKAVGLSRSTHRRLPQAQSPTDPDVALRAWLRSYATKPPCHGFRRAWAALRHDGTADQVRLVHHSAGRNPLRSVTLRGVSITTAGVG